MVSRLGEKTSHVILRRRGDTFERVIREHLGGALFATEGQVEQYFKWTDCEIERGDNFEAPLSDNKLAELNRMWKFVARCFDGRNEIAERIEEHIRTAPEREAVALRRANGAR